MSELYRSTPLEDIQTIEGIYGSSNHESIPFLKKLDETQEFLSNLVRGNQLKNYGAVLAIEGSWGSGKTTFVKLLLQSMKEMNIATVEYDSLYYGDPSEAASIFIKDIFDTIEDYFGVRLDARSNIIKNITPNFEVSNGMPKLSLDFTSKRVPTEKVLKKELGASLRNLNGRIIVVIDDLDRVSSPDVMHFLRIVRVLREMPNIITILPIDREALIRLLKKQGIDEPNLYLQKIIDKSFSLDSDPQSAFQLFNRLLNNKFSPQLNSDLIITLWQLYIWEICLHLLQPQERNGQIFSMATQPTDAAWAQLTDMQPLQGDNLVREFFKRTSKAYGAQSNFVMRVITNDPARDTYQHYSGLFTGNSFTEFLRGSLYPTTPIDPMSQGGMLIGKWWDDTATIIPEMRATNQNLDPTASIQRIRVSSDPNIQSEHYERLNRDAQTIWSTVRDLAQENLPLKAFPNLTPRVINKFINALELTDFLRAANPEESLPQLGEAVRHTVEKVIVKR